MQSPLYEGDSCNDESAGSDSAESVEDSLPMNHLSSDVPEKLVRAVKPLLVTSGFGRKFACKTGSFAETEADYSKSLAVAKIDDFISHSWQTERWTKFLAVCMVYNMPAAAVLSWLAALLVLVLQLEVFSVLPRSVTFQVKHGGEVFHCTYSYLGLVLCPCIFLFISIFWQYICLPTMVFVDKFCIHQSNQKLKQDGIRGIAGILRHSERLVVLWTESYFTRLWCTYELASWVYLGKSRIRFVPVSFAALACLLMFSLYAELVLGAAWEAQTGSIPVWLVFGTWMIFSLVGAVFAQAPVRELSSLPRQLAEFSVQKTHCFCCDHNHINPSTSERILCDRSLVYDALKGWFSEQSESSESSDSSDSGEKHHLRFFDREVRKILHGSMLPGSYRVAYKDALVLTSPSVWFYVPRAVYLETMPPLEWARWALFIVSMIFAAMPCAYQIYFILSSFSERVVVGSSRSWPLRGLSIALSTVCIFCTFMFGWALAAFPLYFCTEPIYSIYTSSFLAILTAILYGGCYLRRLLCLRP